MKLIISLTLVWTLCGTARALTCLECTNPENLGCSSPLMRQCLDDELCFNGFSTDQNGVQRIFRRCVGGSVCTAPTSGTVSSNVGGVHYAVEFKCCDTDQCNNEVLQFPEVPTDNGDSCPGSENPDDVFSATVNCKGDEHTCFSGITQINGDDVIIGGCGTSNVCDFGNTFRALPVDVGFFDEPLTCIDITTTTTTTTTTTAPTTTAPMTKAPSATNQLQKLSIKKLLKVKFLVEKLKLLAAAIEKELLHQQQVMLFQLHLQLIKYQHHLVLQQVKLPIDHYHQLPLYYQQSLLVNHHQLLLHHIQQSLSGQIHLKVLFKKQAKVLYKLQKLLHDHHYLLYNYYKPDPTSSTTEEPTSSTTEEPTSSTTTTTTQAPTTTTINNV